MKRIVKYLGIAAMVAAPLTAQVAPPDQVDVQEQVDRAMAQAKAAMDNLQTPQFQDQVASAMAQAQKAMENVKLPQLDQIQRQLENLRIDVPDIALGDLKFKLDGMLALGMQDTGDRAQELRERAREERERARELKDRGRESEDRNIEIYRSGTNSIDEHRYERGIENMDRVIAAKWARADGVYYWKAYALNKLGKRDEAQAALAEIPKQFPQSRWIGDANALKAEIQQASGNPVSPENQSDEDLRILAINSLMNSDAERAIPLLEKVLNDPKNNLSLKSRALFVLAQSRSDKGRAIVLQYAKSGTNPDLQIRAINYLGTFRSQASQQALADVYAANNDLSVRRAVLRSMATSRDSAHLFASAKSESNADLRREAIRSLGQMQAASELSQLYANETSPELKETIISSLMMSRDSDKLMEIAKTEKNAELRGDAIRYLGTMHSDKSADGLKSLYAAETDKNVKEQIIRALGQQGAGKQLVDIARAEKDPELKKEDVQWLGRMRGSKEATDYLMELINK